MIEIIAPGETNFNGLLFHQLFLPHAGKIKAHSSKIIPT